jgi:hypothetical protein
MDVRKPAAVVLAGACTLLLADAVVVFDALLLKRYLDRPAVIWSLLALGFLLAAVARRAARRLPDDRRGSIARGLAALSGPAFAFFAVFLLLLGAQHFLHQRATADGRAYFLQIRSLLIDRDVDFAVDAESFGIKLAGDGPDNPGGVTSYALGTPLAWAPFFAAAHGWLGVLNLFGADHARDGYFNPYQRAVGLGSLIYGMAALVLIYLLLRREHTPHVSLLATLAVAAGGVAAWYMSIDATWSHAVSMFATTAFVGYWMVRPRPRSPRTALILGLLAGFMALTRWQNGLFLVLPAADAVAGLWQARHRDRARAWLREQASFAAGCLAGFLPQLIFWRVARGGWFDMPASEHAVGWTSPYALDTLFHTDRGLFTWTPLLGLGVLGLVLAARRQPRSLLLLLALLLQVWVNGTVWWGDHGFGARRFENSTLLFAAGLAVIVEQIRRRPLAGAYLLVVPLVLLNLLFMRSLLTTGLGQQGSVSFRDMAGTVSSALGHPMSLPANALYAWRYESDLTLYERLGSQVFSNALVDLGESGDDRFLGGGWAGRERNDAYTFRWMVGTSAHVLFQAREPAPYSIELRCMPFSWNGAPPQTLDVAFNGLAVGVLELRPDMQTYQIEIPAGIVQPRLNHLHLRTRYARSPASLRLGPDDRPLSAAFDSISFRRGGT